MKVLLIDIGDDEINAVAREMQKLGNECTVIHKNYSQVHPFSEAWKNNRYDDLHIEKYDIVFTTNFFPELSKLCAQSNVYYFAWVLHMPCIALYSDAIVLPTNRVFCLEKNLVQLFQSSGIGTVYYLPYAVDVCSDISGGKKGVAVITELDIADRHGVYKVLENTKDSTKGYLDGAAAAQAAVYPEMILPKLPGYVMDDILSHLQTVELNGNMATKDWIVREYLFLDMITARERLFECSEISIYKNVTYYMNSRITTKGIKQEENVKKGLAEQLDIYSRSAMGISMPKRSYYNCLYKETLRIMAGGALALSPYSEELADSFENGENIMMYTNDNEFKELVEYYCNHEDECLQMGKIGREKVLKFHNYEVRVRDMLSTVV